MRRVGEGRAVTVWEADGGRRMADGGWRTADGDTVPIICQLTLKPLFLEFSYKTDNLSQEFSWAFICTWYTFRQ